MISIIVIMGLGIMVGYILRHRKLGSLGYVMTAAIWMLLFLLGVQAGNDERIINGISSLGMDAAVISAGGVTGSCLFAMLLWKYSRDNNHKKGGGCER